MSETLRVALVQMCSGIEPAANRAQAWPLLREAASDGARLVAVPETATRMDLDRERVKAALRREDDDEELRAWAKMARELGVFLILGSHLVLADDGRALNRCFLFGPDGKVAARYDKINLFDVTLKTGEQHRESDYNAPGGRAVVAEGPGGVKIGLTICYDLRFPELYRALANAGAQLITVPAAFTRPTGEAHWETLLRARAIETGAFILAPAQGGRHENGRGTWGRSMIVSPWGAVVAKLDHDSIGVLAADLDLAAVEEARSTIPAWRGGNPFVGPAA